MESEFECVLLEAFTDPELSRTDQTRALQLMSQFPNPATVRDEDGISLLHHACRNEWGDVAKVLMEQYIQCQGLDPTIIFLAFEYPSTTGTDQAHALQLLSQLPNPAALVDDDRTLLHWACKNEWSDVAKQLLEGHIQCQTLDHAIISLAFEHPSTTDTDQPGALQLLSQLPSLRSHWIKDKHGKVLLHYAYSNEWDDVVKVLIETVEHGSRFEHILLEVSGVSQAHVLQLLSYHPNPTILMDHHGITLLHLACWNEWSDAAKQLLEEHIQCKTLNYTIVLLAFEHPSTVGIDQTCALQLLSQLPNINLQAQIQSFFYYACKNEWDDIIKVLIQMAKSARIEIRLELERILLQSSTASGIHQACALELLSQLPNPVAVKDINGNTLLQWACRNGWLGVVIVLVEQHHCDPEYQPGFIKMSVSYSDIGAAIHWACSEDAGHLDIVKYLVKQGCDPECRNSSGMTPLHLACEAGHLDIVKFLVLEQHCNPLQPATKFGVNLGYTPLHAACSSGHHDVSAFLLSSGKADHLLNLSNRIGFVAKFLRKKVKLSSTSDYPNHDNLSDILVSFEYPTIKYLEKDESVQLSSWYGSNDFFANFLACRRNHPFHPAFKIFIMGNPSAGKSTLVKAIQNRITNASLLGSFIAKFKKVSGVKLHTAGIIPVPMESKDLGSIIMYDLAGQYQYYSSHAALLEKLVASPGALLMVVIDLSKSNEETVRTLQYWNSFIENHCSQESSRPSVVIIGSHADVVKLQKENPAQKSKDIQITSNSLQALEIIPLNCTQLASDGLTKVCDVIAEKCSQFRRKFDIHIQVHFLYAFLSKEFKYQTACKVSEIMSRIIEDQNTEMEVEEHTITLLPHDTATLSQHLTTLTEKGQFLYLRNFQNFEDSWVILDQEVLLSDINGTIFAPENFKEHHDISSSTGVVPFSKIEETFSQHNPEMIISFLSYLEFCQQIAESEASVISEGHLGGSQQLAETFYFFPALVSEDRPEESCKSIEQTHYKCGWSLQCIRPDQFLSPRFLHVLLLRLAFSFALAPETTDEDKACPVLQRRCNVWKAGIHWQNRDGVEAIVEVVEQNTAVTMMMGCLEGREVACIGLRSEVIQTILDAKERFCGAVELRESLVHPAELSSYPMKTPKLLPSFTITELATAVSEHKEVVTCKQGHAQQMLSISELLYFEPYTCFTPSLLAEMFKDENLDKEVPDVFYLDAGKVAHTEMKCFKQALTFNESEFEAAISNATQPYRDSAKHHCYLLFRTWALCSPNPTYQALRTALDKFSVFCGRNPLLLARQVPSFPQSTSVASKAKSMPTRKSHGTTADLCANTYPPAEPMPMRKSCDTTADLCTIPCRSDKPSLQELECLQGRGRRRVRVIESVATHWEDLALALHFETIEIEHITDLSYQTEDACREVLRRWLQGRGKTRQPVNWATLIDSLIEAGFIDVAEELQEVVKDPLLPQN